MDGAAQQQPEATNRRSGEAFNTSKTAEDRAAPQGEEAPLSGSKRLSNKKMNDLAESAAKRRKAELEAEGARDDLIDSKIAKLEHLAKLLPSETEIDPTLRAVLQQRKEALATEISSLIEGPGRMAGARALPTEAAASAPELATDLNQPDPSNPENRQVPESSGAAPFAPLLPPGFDADNVVI